MEALWIAAIKDVVRKLSAHRFQQHSQQAVAINDLPMNAGPVFAHWMSIILLAGQGIRFTIKVHYQTREVMSLAKSILSAGNHAEELSKAADFMREYCNLLAGSLKTTLLEKEVDLGISLPIVVRGFDDVFSEKKRASTDYFQDAWALTADSGDNPGKVVCVLSVGVYANQLLDRLAKVSFSEPTQEESSDMEFL